jgi:uncharacterized protein
MKASATFIAAGFMLPFKRFFEKHRQSSTHGSRDSGPHENDRVVVMRIEMDVLGIELGDADLNDVSVDELDPGEIARTMPADADGEALYELGMMYAAGRSGAADLVAAHKWLNVAVARGCVAAARRRAELAFEMSAEEVAVAQRQARLWLSGTYTRH